MSDTTTVNKYDWEVPEIDLNLRHYSGPVSDVFKIIKYDIVQYLMEPGVTPKSRSIYSAVYNALDYYEIISPDFSVDRDFLNSTIQTFTEDLDYLSSKYRPDSPLDPEVISLSARIKSPLSFVEKVKDKVNEYLEQGRDFVYFNESLRDIIGVRIVVDPPASVKAQGFQAESDYVYEVFNDLMTLRGIRDEETDITPFGKFKFIKVNSRYDKNKLEKMKSVKYEGPSIYSDEELTEEQLESIKNYRTIVIPRTRPEYMEEVDNKVKDYRKYPKTSGYQSIHVCVDPYYSSAVKKPQLPTCIIPPASSPYSIEYQFRDARENDFSDKGPASHNNLKPYEKVYHRLAVPSFIDAIDYRSPLGLSTTLPRKVLKPRDFGENFQKFYGPSFEDRFNISYHMFQYTFDEFTQNEILAGRMGVEFDPNTNTYDTIPLFTPICIEESDRDAMYSSKLTAFDMIRRANIDDSTISTESAKSKSDDNNSKFKNIRLLKVLPARRKKKVRTFGKVSDIKEHQPHQKACNEGTDGQGLDDDL